jgi:Flp pilus assembly protein TadD
MKKQRGAFGSGGKVRHAQRTRANRPARAEKSLGQREFIISAVLAIATLAVYGQVIGHQFISLDDPLYIRDNRMVAGGLTLKGIAWAFTTFHATNWHPLTWLSHMLDSQIFGLSAGGPLFVNALIHVSNILLLFFFLRRITGACWRSAMVAALFALHPLHVESVAWAAERKDTLATFFGLLCLFAYTRYVEESSWKRFALVVLWLGLGLMAKPMLVTWPFVLLLLDYWPLNRLKWQPVDGLGRFGKAWLPLIREKLPLFCLVVASGVVTYVAQAHGGAVRGLVDTPLSLRLANASVSYAKYLLLTFWPKDLAVFYPFPFAGLPAWQIASSLILLAVISAITLREARKRPYLITGWLWFLGTLIPVIGLVQVGGQAMADRYHYIPSIGLFVAVVFGLADLATAWRVSRVIISLVCVTALLIFACLTGIQLSLWRDSVTLFERTLAVTTDNSVIHYNLGHILGEQAKYDEAAPHFAEALRIKPDFFYALINMGLARAGQGRVKEAVDFYDRALKIEPNSSRAHLLLGLTLANQEKKGDALQEFYRALEFDPNDPDVRINLGRMLAEQGKLRDAGEQLNEALRLNPASAEANNNLGLVLLAEGRAEESLSHFSAALRLKPEFAAARDNLRRAQRKIETRSK